MLIEIVYVKMVILRILKYMLVVLYMLIRLKEYYFITFLIVFFILKTKVIYFSVYIIAFKAIIRKLL
jgi:hypothetical protein